MPLQGPSTTSAIQTPSYPTNGPMNGPTVSMSMQPPSLQPRISSASTATSSRSNLDGSLVRAPPLLLASAPIPALAPSAHAAASTTSTSFFDDDDDWGASDELLAVLDAAEKKHLSTQPTTQQSPPPPQVRHGPPLPPPQQASIPQVPLNGTHVPHAPVSNPPASVNPWQRAPMNRNGPQQQQQPSRPGPSQVGVQMSNSNISISVAHTPQQHHQQSMRPPTG